MTPRREKLTSIPQATVLFLISESRILLARKKRKIGKGKWNGYGGFRESQDETLRKTAVRETSEESGGVIVDPKTLEKAAVMTYDNEQADGSIKKAQVHYYFARQWIGVPTETKEMGAPQWFPQSDLPFGEMLPTDAITFPYIFNGVKLTGRGKFNMHEGKLLPGSMRLRRWRI